MRIDDMFSMKTWGQLAWNPVRPQLYFCESVPDKRGNRMQHRIMRLDTRDAQREPIALTQGTHDQRPVCSPDGNWIGFLSRRSGSSQVWRMAVDGGEAIQVTDVEGGVKDFTFSPNGDAVVIVTHLMHGLLEKTHPAADVAPDWSDSELEDHYNKDVRHIVHQYYKLDGTGFFDQGRDQLVYVSIDSGEMELLTSGFDHCAEPVFDASGQHLYFLRRPYDSQYQHPSITRVEKLDLVNHQRVTLSLPDLAISGLALSEDGTRLAFCASDPQKMGYGLTVLYQYALDTATLTDLSGALDRSVGDESATDVPALSSARPIWYKNAVYMLLSDEGRVMVAAFQPSAVRRLDDQKRVVYDFALSDGRLAMALSDPTHPSGMVLAALDDAAREDIIWAPRSWTGLQPVEPQEIFASEQDGTKVHTWALFPPEASDQVPAILEIHGGPMSMYGYRYHHEFQCLVAEGYAVVYTNPRGSQGYGEAFCQAIIGDWGNRDYRDVSAGLDAAIAAWPRIDPERLGVAGGSYGGFMVNWMISHSDRFKAAVTMRSVVNRFSAMGSSDLGWLRVPQYGTRPWWEDPEPYWQQSPLRYASNIHTPLLIEHQEKDFRLPIEQGEQLYSALKYLGRPVEMMIYPDESHGMSRQGKPWHRIHRLRSIVSWFNRYLG